jgi:hypothetical protein
MSRTRGTTDTRAAGITPPTLALWAAFVLYVAVAAVTIFRHELWGDEFHSWNIAKASAGLGALIDNSRYEGHPPVWYLVLWSLSRVTHNPASMQVVQFAIAVAVAALLIFRSPLPFAARVLSPFGYFFLFEYGVLSRNYAIGILLVLCACIALERGQARGPPRALALYAALLAASCTHLLALLLCASLHLSFLIEARHGQRPPATARALLAHAAIGAAVLLPAAWFILPPTDSRLGVGFWMKHWDASQQLAALVRAPLRAFVPMPAWWRHDFWNTQFLVEVEQSVRPLRFVVPLLSLAVVALGVLVLRGSRHAVTLFASNLLLTAAVALVFPLTSARYTGFIYVGFIVACWRSSSSPPSSPSLSSSPSLPRPRSFASVCPLHFFLVSQLAAAALAVSRDLRLPFSQAPRIRELVAEVPPGERLVTDYWAEDTAVAFLDYPLLCVGFDRPLPFLRWDAESASRTFRPYSSSLPVLLRRERRERVFLVSTYSLAVILDLDPPAREALQLRVVASREGAIERWSNLYLYEARLVFRR